MQYNENLIYKNMFLRRSDEPFQRRLIKRQYNTTNQQHAKIW